MKPFNLEHALKGKPVVTRDGRVATHIEINSCDENRITARIPLRNYQNEYVCFGFEKNGSFYDDGILSDRDLFMGKPPREHKPINTERATLFTTAFVQVLLVSCNTVLLAHNKTALSIAVAGLISYVWTFNVKRAAFGSHWDKIIYSLGAACGSGVGIYLARLFL